MTIKFKVTHCNSHHCNVLVYAGEDAEHLQSCGTLVFRPQEYLLFATAQLLAKDIMQTNYVVLFDDKLFREYQSTR